MALSPAGNVRLFALQDSCSAADEAPEDATVGAGMWRASLQRFADPQGAGAMVAATNDRAVSTGIVDRPPVVSPLPPLAERPFWSVMIPTYNCREDHLRE